MVVFKIITYEEIFQFVEENSNCELLSDKYVSANTKMNFRCVCGDEFFTTFWQFKNNNKRQCNKCGHERRAREQRLSYSYIKEFIENESDSGCELLSDKYINNETKLNIKCQCGNIFEQTFSKFKDRLTARMCEVCNGKISWNIEKVTKFIKENSNCTLLSKEYIRHDKKLRFICECGDEFETTWLNFVHANKRRCDKCGIKSTVQLLNTPKEVLLNDLYDVHGNDYTIVGNYVNKNTKVTTRHNICGFEWDVEPRNLVGNAGKSPTGCPICKSSKGVLHISSYLTKNNIEYKTEYWFEDCRYIYPLPFDFYLDKFNIIIEYDGEHHYMPVGFSGDNNIAKSKFKETKRNDQIKNQYCKDNNIPLLRIPYWEFNNIEKIIDEILINYKKGV